VLLLFLFLPRASVYPPPPPFQLHVYVGVLFLLLVCLSHKPPLCLHTNKRTLTAIFTVCAATGCYRDGRLSPVTISFFWKGIMDHPLAAGKQLVPSLHLDLSLSLVNLFMCVPCVRVCVRACVRACVRVFLSPPPPLPLHLALSLLSHTLSFHAHAHTFIHTLQTLNR
jgi:hypothetical protein